MSDLRFGRHPLAALNDPATIRARCGAILRAVQANVSEHFTVDLGALDAVADRVAALTRSRFPDLRIPVHSRWRHFEAGGVDRKPVLDARLAGRSAADAARARFDLTVVSVLLDAGAGGEWRYAEPGAEGARDARGSAGAEGADADGAEVAEGAEGAEGADGADGAEGAGGAAGSAAATPPLLRSEGLGVASWHAFLAGTFSAMPQEDPLRADAAVLERCDAALLRPVFQATPTNPIVGLEGRAGLLSRLGAVLREAAARAGQPAAAARPALLFDLATGGGTRSSVPAAEVLGHVLKLLAPIWTSGSRVQGLPAGDVWPHRWAGAAVGGGLSDPTTGGYVPFHKLSQWLTYSLIEPLQWAGVEVTGLDALTGLPEYRNGGLLLDAGVIVPRRAAALDRTWKPQDDFIVEWRALTVALLDLLAPRVRERLGRSEEELPLACILEGGTWAAGRAIAAERREGGAPPLKIDSDGTVF